MAGLLTEDRDRANVSSGAGGAADSGGSGSVRKESGNDNWEYKAEDDKWYARRTGSEDWKDITDRHKAAVKLDRQFPGERSPAAMRASAEAHGASDTSYIPADAPPPPESGGEWEDVVRAPKMELPMSSWDHQVEIGGETGTLGGSNSHEMDVRDTWWDESRQHYLVITDLLRDLSHGLMDNPTQFPSYSQNDFKSKVPNDDSDVRRTWDIDDVGRALDYFRVNHTKNRRRSAGTKYVEDDANAIDHYIRRLANQAEQAEVGATTQSESLLRGRKGNVMKKEGRDIRRLRETVRRALVRDRVDEFAGPLGRLATAAAPALKKAGESIVQGAKTAGQGIASAPGKIASAPSGYVNMFKDPETGKVDAATMMMTTQGISAAAAPLLGGLKDAVGGIFGEDEQGALTQAIQQNPRMADAAAIYSAGAGKTFGTDEQAIRTIIAKNLNDLPGLARDYTAAVAIITNGKGSGELVTTLQDEGGLDAEAQQILDAITASSGQSAPAMPPQAGMPTAAPVMPQVGAPGIMGQPMPIREARFRKLIRQELLKIL